MQSTCQSSVIRQTPQRGSQLGRSAPREPLAMSADILGCQSWGEGATSIQWADTQNAAKTPRSAQDSPPPQNPWAQNVTCAVVEKVLSNDKLCEPLRATSSPRVKGTTRGGGALCKCGAAALVATMRATLLAFGRPGLEKPRCPPAIQNYHEWGRPWLSRRSQRRLILGS